MPRRGVCCKACHGLIEQPRRFGVDRIALADAVMFSVVVGYYIWLALL